MVEPCPPCCLVPPPRFLDPQRGYSMHTQPALQTSQRRERGDSPAANREDPQQMIPPAENARLDHVRIGVARAGVDPAHLCRGRHAMSLRLQAVPEDVRDQAQLGLFADRTDRLGRGANVARRPDQLRVRVTDRFLSKPTSLDLSYQHPPREAMVDNATRTTICPFDRAYREAHRGRG